MCPDYVNLNRYDQEVAVDPLSSCHRCELHTVNAKFHFLGIWEEKCKIFL